MSANERRPAGNGAPVEMVAGTTVRVPATPARDATAAGPVSLPGVSRDQSRTPTSHRVGTRATLTAGAPDPDGMTVIHAPDVELAVLGTALAAPDAAAEVLAGLEPDDFAEPRHRALLDAALRVMAAGAAPSPELVLERLHRDGAVRMVAGQPAALLVHEAFRHARPTAAMKHYHGVLLRMRWRREVAQFGAQLVRLADLGSDEQVHGAFLAAEREVGRTLARLAGVAR